MILEASAGPDVDLGGPLGAAAKIAEQALTATGWGAFRVSQGVWVAGTEHGVAERVKEYRGTALMYR